MWLSGHGWGIREKVFGMTADLKDLEGEDLEGELGA
jgi:hypothetical protein